ncbi:MAG: hypothetical protein J7M14_05440, partial [Planctomycetes bacterium]|nr:hypothetical protein [Planctomycetota bacterium]
SWGVIGGKFMVILIRFGEGQVGGSRMKLWVKAARYVLQHPIPDPEGWWLISDREPHNTFLSAGVEGGPIALAGLTGIAIIIAIRGWRLTKSVGPEDWLWVCALFILLFTTLATVSSISLIGHKVMWTLFAACGVQFLEEDATFYAPPPKLLPATERVWKPSE